MTLKEVKGYLRVDDDMTDDDELIQSFMTAAQTYIVNQTGKTYDPTSDIWNTCIKMLVSHWYENRLLTPNRSGQLTVEFPHSATALIHHIAMCSAYAEVTT